MRIGARGWIAVWQYAVTGIVFMEDLEEHDIVRSKILHTWRESQRKDVCAAVGRRPGVRAFSPQRHSTGKKAAALNAHSSQYSTMARLVFHRLAALQVGHEEHGVCNTWLTLASDDFNNLPPRRPTAVLWSSGEFIINHTNSTTQF